MKFILYIYFCLKASWQSCAGCLLWVSEIHRSYDNRHFKQGKLISLYAIKHNVHRFTLSLHGLKIMIINKLPIKYYFLMFCSFWEMSIIQGHTNYFSMNNLFTSTGISLRDFSLFFSKQNLKTNEAETSTGKLYYMYIHPHSQWVGIHVMAKKTWSTKGIKPL